MNFVNSTKFRLKVPNYSKGDWKETTRSRKKFTNAFFFLAICIQVPAVLIDLIDPWLEGLIDFMWVPQRFPNLKSCQVVADA